MESAGQEGVVRRGASTGRRLDARRHVSWARASTPADLAAVTAASLAGVLGLAAVAAVVAGCSTPRVEAPGGRGGAGGTATERTDGPRGGTGITLPEAGAGAGGSDGGPPVGSCAARIDRAERAPLDLMFLVDSSSSMGGIAGTRSKWQMVHEALSTFLRDQMSAGLGVGLVVFPREGPAKVCAQDGECTGSVPGFRCTERRCVERGGFAGSAFPCFDGLALCPAGASCVPVGRCSQSGTPCAEIGRPCPDGAADTCDLGVRTCLQTADAGCEPAIYAKPLVSIGELPGALPAMQGALDRVGPAGNTPMLPAVTGALQHLGAHVGANPGRRAALVVATDGLPDGCMSGPQSIPQVAAALAAARMAPATIPSYVIGVFAADTLAASRPALEQLAAAGGTGAPFILEPNADLTTRFLAALNEIRGGALACEFQIPRPASGTQDYGKVNVRFTSAPGATPEELVYVVSADRCDPARGGWYYDVPPATGTPRRIIVCDSTCARFKQQTTGAVEIAIGCTTRVE
jgi:hypothetical protein